MKDAGEWEKCFQTGAVKAGMRAGINRAGVERPFGTVRIGFGHGRNAYFRRHGAPCRRTAQDFLRDGGAFFEKNAAAMEQRLKECALDIHKQIDFYRKDYVEKMKVICPVGILGGIMISIMLI